MDSSHAVSTISWGSGYLLRVIKIKERDESSVFHFFGEVECRVWIVVLGLAATRGGAIFDYRIRLDDRIYPIQPSMHKNKPPLRTMMRMMMMKSMISWLGYLVGKASVHFWKIFEFFISTTHQA